MADLAVKILPDSKKEDDEDLRLKYIRPFESSYSIGNSAVAVTQVKDEVGRMRDMVSKNISDAFDTLIRYDDKLRTKVAEREEYIDYLNKGISEYVVSLMTRYLRVWTTPGRSTDTTLSSVTLSGSATMRSILQSMLMI